MENLSLNIDYHFHWVQRFEIKMRSYSVQNFFGGSGWVRQSHCVAQVGLEFEIFWNPPSSSSQVLGVCSTTPSLLKFNIWPESWMAPGLERAEVRLKGGDSVLREYLCKSQMVFSHLSWRCLLVGSQTEMAQSSIVSVVNILIGFTWKRDEFSVVKCLTCKYKNLSLDSRTM